MSSTTPDSATQALNPAPRDASQIVPGDWSKLAMPAVGGQRGPGFQVVLRQSVLKQIHRHGQESRDIEICGVLVGSVHHDENGPWLYVQHAVEGNGAASRAAQVTFTAQTWQHIQAVMDKDYPDLRILGWYHTHPGFGVFLSDMDIFIQENFFGEPWQTALVYDPKAHEQGIFVWTKGRPEAQPYLIEPDCADEKPAAMIEKARETPPPNPGADIGVMNQRIEAIEKRQRLILILLVVVMLVALVWPLTVGTLLPGLMKPAAKPQPAESTD